MKKECWCEGKKNQCFAMIFINKIKKMCVEVKKINEIN